MSDSDSETDISGIGTDSDSDMDVPLRQLMPVRPMDRPTVGANQRLDQQLFNALDNDDIAEASRLLQSGANINAYDVRNEEDVFDKFIRSFTPEFLELMIQYRYNFNAAIEEEVQSPSLGYKLISIFIRTRGGGEDLAEIVMRYFPFNVNEVNARGLTLLHLAIVNNERVWSAVGLIQWLLRHGADPNARVRDTGDTTLILVSKEASEYNMYNELKQIITLLLQYGADPRLRNNERRNAFDIHEEFWPIYRRFGYKREQDRRRVLLTGQNMPPNVNETIYRFLRR